MSESWTTTRRGALRVLGLFGAGGAAAGIAACSSHGQPHGHGSDSSEVAVVGSVADGGPLGSRPLATSTTTDPPRAGAGPNRTVMIVRHAEKPDGEGPRGVMVDGRTDPHALTVAGWARAGALVELFASARNPAPPGLARPDAVYAGFGGGSAGLRPLQTVVPVAARLGQRVAIHYAKGQESALAGELRGRTGATLVCWEHKAISDIVAALGPVTPTPPASWPDDRFDLVWVFTADGAGWRFQQVPQLLLAGDRADPAV